MVMVADAVALVGSVKLGDCMGTSMFTAEHLYIPMSAFELWEMVRVRL